MKFKGSNIKTKFKYFHFLGVLKREMFSLMIIHTMPRTIVYKCQHNDSNCGFKTDKL